MPSGKLDERFAFDRRSETADGAGNFEESWMEMHGPCAAGLIFMRGGEDVIAARLNGVKPVIITIRDCAGARAITTDWRARDVRRGTVYNVRDITPAQRNGYIDIMAQSGVADG